MWQINSINVQKSKQLLSSHGSRKTVSWNKMQTALSSFLWLRWCSHHRQRPQREGWKCRSRSWILRALVVHHPLAPIEDAVQRQELGRVNRDKILGIRWHVSWGQTLIDAFSTHVRGRKCGLPTSLHLVCHGFIHSFIEPIPYSNVSKYGQHGEKTVLVKLWPLKQRKNTGKENNVTMFFIKFFP